MSRRVVLIAGVLVLLLVASAGIRFVAVNPSAGDAPRREARVPGPAQVPGPGSNADRVVLTVELPAKGEPLMGGGPGHGPDCPQTQVSALLGIRIASPHGVIVAQALSGGPAGEGGVMRGDSIVECDGEAVTCPSKLLPLLEQGEERRPLQLTVLRTAVADSEGRPAERQQQ